VPQADAPPPAVPEQPTTNGAATGATPAAVVTSLDEARSRYRQVYERLKQQSGLFAAWLNGGDIVGLDAGSITFALPHPTPVTRLTTGSPGHVALAEVVVQVFGRPYTVHCLHQADVEDRLRALPTRPSHLVDEAIKLGARPLDTQ